MMDKHDCILTFSFTIHEASVMHRFLLSVRKYRTHVKGSLVAPKTSQIKLTDIRQSAK